MANVLSRTAPYVYLTSVNDPLYPPQDWIINPDLSAVRGFDPKYWSVTGDTVSLLSQAERDAIDAAEETARLDSIADELTQTQSILRAFAEVVLDEFNTLRSEHSLAPRTLSQLRNAVRGKL